MQVIRSTSRSTSRVQGEEEEEEKKEEKKEKSKNPNQRFGKNTKTHGKNNETVGEPVPPQPSNPYHHFIGAMTF